jgi:hypothetical protein
MARVSCPSFASLLALPQLRTALLEARPGSNESSGRPSCANSNQVLLTRMGLGLS